MEKYNRNKIVNDSYSSLKEGGKYEILHEYDLEESKNDDYQNLLKENNNDNKENRTQNHNQIQSKKSKNKKIENSNIITIIYYNDKILNNKKMKWEVELKKISGWFSIGISENYVYSSDSNTVNLRN